MRQAHKHLKLSSVHFDAIVENLKQTLEELRID
jgi:hypothetical protein